MHLKHSNTRHAWPIVRHDTRLHIQRNTGRPWRLSHLIKCSNAIAPLWWMGQLGKQLLVQTRCRAQGPACRICSSNVCLGVVPDRIDGAQRRTPSCMHIGVVRKRAAVKVLHPTSQDALIRPSTWPVMKLRAGWQQASNIAVMSQEPCLRNGL